MRSSTARCLSLSGRPARSWDATLRRKSASHVFAGCRPSSSEGGAGRRWTTSRGGGRRRARCERPRWPGCRHARCPARPRGRAPIVVRSWSCLSRHQPPNLVPDLGVLPHLPGAVELVQRELRVGAQHAARADGQPLDGGQDAERLCSVVGGRAQASPQLPALVALIDHRRPAARARIADAAAVRVDLELAGRGRRRQRRAELVHTLLKLGEVALADHSPRTRRALLSKSFSCTCGRKPACSKSSSQRSGRMNG